MWLVIEAACAGQKVECGEACNWLFCGRHTPSLATPWRVLKSNPFLHTCSAVFTFLKRFKTLVLHIYRLQTMQSSSYPSNSRDKKLIMSSAFQILNR